MTLIVSVGLVFQPGWANGWPGGISKHAVFASFAAAVFVVVSVSFASAALVWLGVFVEQVVKRPFAGWTTFLVALILVTAYVLFACPQVYSEVHADIVREWP